MATRASVIGLCAATAGALWAGVAGCARGATVQTPRGKPAFSAPELMAVCWPHDASADARLQLTFVRDGARLREVMFEVAGAGNSVGRCARELSFAYPWTEGELPERLSLTPPAGPPSGWAVLAYVDLIAATVPQVRGLRGVGPLVRSCLAQGEGLRPGVHFVVQPSPTRVLVQAGDRPSSALTDSERCVMAVLGSADYPSTRPLVVSLADAAGAPAPEGDVSAYFVPRGLGTPGAPLEAGVVKETVSARLAAVTVCWEAALDRRPGLGGGRTFRIRVAPGGHPQGVQVIANRSDAPEEASDYLLDRCLAEVLRRTRFPNPEDRPAEAVYSWVFATR